MSKKFRKGVTGVEPEISSDIIQLYNAADVQNAKEAVAVFFHACMLQYRFVPKDVSNEDKYMVMPKDWNAKGVIKISYVHFCCPPFTCCMTCVPLYKNVSVHGIVSDTECSESVCLQLKIDKYLKQGKEFSDVSEVFCNVEELSRYFKDYFCLPLLNLLHETHGKKHLYGFPGLFDELKMLILQLLPVGGVVSMSAVNKNFHDLADSHILWKYLFRRDFSKGGIPDVDATSSDTNWKERYRKEYIKKKRKPERRICMFPRQRLPQLYTVDPDYDPDLSINFDPPFPGTSFFDPFIPQRLPPHFFRRF